MSFLTRAAALRLVDEGYHLIPPGEPRPLPFYDDDSAIQYVRNLGYTVIKTRMPQPPRVGTQWRPVRGKARHGVAPKLEPRWVRSIGPGSMSYALSVDGLPITINMASWHDWVRKTRAVRV